MSKVPEIQPYTIEVSEIFFGDDAFASEDLSVREQGQRFGYYAVHRPELNQVVDAELASDSDFQSGVLEGLRVAAYSNNSLGEEQ